MNKIFTFSVSLVGSSSFALASLPLSIGSATAQEAKAGDAADLGVMSISLKDAIQPNFGFQGALQGAGTPNQAGIGGFLPLVTGDNSVFFIDAQANVNFADYNTYSSIINTTVAGTTISTSSRLGYRFLNSDRSWMFGVNAGYDSRPMATGAADTGVNVRNSSTVFFQQVAAGLEAVSNTWNFNAYALVPVGTSEYRLNSNYFGGALDTYELDVGYAITPDFKASIGYYYQSGDLNTADGSGVRGRLAYNLTNGLAVGGNLSYDQAFETRVSADIKYRFGANGYGAPGISKQQPVVMPVIQALSTTPANRDVRVHDEKQQGCTYYAMDFQGKIIFKGVRQQANGAVCAPSIYCSTRESGTIWKYCEQSYWVEDLYSGDLGGNTYPRRVRLPTPEQLEQVHNRAESGNFDMTDANTLWWD